MLCLHILEVVLIEKSGPFPMFIRIPYITRDDIIFRENRNHFSETNFKKDNKVIENDFFEKKSADIMIPLKNEKMIQIFNQ